MKHEDIKEDKKLIKEEIAKAKAGKKMKRGGKAKHLKHGGKVEGEKAKVRLDRPARKSVALGATDSGVSPSNPLAKMKKGGSVAGKK